MAHSNVLKLFRAIAALVAVFFALMSPMHVPGVGTSQLIEVAGRHQASHDTKIALVSQAQAWRKGAAPPPGPWDPLSDPAIASNILYDFDAMVGVSTSGGVVTSIANQGTAGGSATPFGTGPAYSATARNGLPGITFSANNAERLQFTPTGMPTGTADSTTIVVSYNAGGAGTAASYGNGVTTDSRRVETTAANVVAVAYGGLTLTTTVPWSSTDKIIIASHQSPSLTQLAVDGNTEQGLQYTVNWVTSAAKGRIGNAPFDTNPFNGVVQRAIFINRKLTAIERAKFAGYLAHRYALTGLLRADHPYKTVAPTTADTAIDEPYAAYESKWVEPFTSLSLRTGLYWSGNNSGYNTPAARGTWAPAGHNYMTSAIGYNDYGYGVFLNSAYDFQATDPAFPPLAMGDITDDGYISKGSEDWPLIRALVGTYGTNRTKFLSDMIATAQSMKIKPPFMREYVFTLNTPDPTNRVAEFPALWGLSETYNGSLPATGLSAVGSYLTVGGLGAGPPDQTTVIPGMRVDGGSGCSGSGLDWLQTADVNSGTGTGGAGTYSLEFPMPTGWTGSISGTTMTITASNSTDYPLRAGMTVTGTGISGGTQILARVSATTGYNGTYTVNNSQVVGSTSNIAASASCASGQLQFIHLEIDDFERFGSTYSNNTVAQSTKMPLGSYDRGGAFNLGVAQANTQHTVRLVQEIDYIYLYNDGILTFKVPNLYDVLNNRNHAVINMANGFASWEGYPGNVTGRISGTTLTAGTITDVSTKIIPGSTLFATSSGITVTPNTTILPYGTAGTTGTGKGGTYALSQSSTVGATFTGTVGNATISAITQANPGVVTTSSPHGFITGELLSITASSPSTYNTTNKTITVLSPTTFSYATDTSALAAYSGSGIASNNKMTVTGISGTINTGNIDTVSGTGMLSFTTVTSQVSGTPNGNGLYQINQSASANGSSLAINKSMTVNGVVQNPSMTVRRVEITAPASNTSGIFPPAPPIPLIAWGGSFSAGAVPQATASGTTVATLSGASGTAATATGTGSGTNLTISSVTGTVWLGQTVTGTGVPDGTWIKSQTSGTTGGAGVYVTSKATTASGAALTFPVYSLMDYNGTTPSGLVIDGTNVKTSGTLVSGAYDFYIRGINSDGTPGIAPKKRVVIAGGTTFNAADCSASGCGLSGGNLTVTNPNVSAWYGARTLASVDSGEKAYAEFAVNGIAGNTAIGVGTSALNLNSTGLAGPGNSIAYYWNGEAYDNLGVQFTNGMPTGSANGTIVGLAIDGTAKKAWYRVANGAWNIGLGGTQDPATGAGGFDLSTLANLYPFALAYGGGVGNGLTANFGGTAYTYTAPSGFGAVQ